MTQFIKPLFAEHHVRKSYTQKSNFIEYVKNCASTLGYNCKIEEARSIKKSRNIIIGDPNTSKVIFTAHYDTCAVIPLPNFMCTNKFMFVFFQLFIALLIILGASAPAIILILLGKFSIAMPVYYICMLLAIYQMMFGIANKHTANDNTSGTAELFWLMENMPSEYRDKICFVFFDNEEAGLLGSSAFYKAHPKAHTKPLINFDCISDGDHIKFVFKNNMMDSPDFHAIEKALDHNAAAYNKSYALHSAKKVFCPSDQHACKTGIGVFAFNHSKIIGYYTGRIHTPRDTVFDFKNIEYIGKSMIDYIGERYA